MARPIAGVAPRIEVTLLIDQYAQHHFLGTRRKQSLAETVRAWVEYAPQYIPLPHPSPRNQPWFKHHPWFERQLVPMVRARARWLDAEPELAPIITKQDLDPVVLTVGHSTRSLADFIALLKAHSVARLIDVRTVPRSRHNPQFDCDTLPPTLAADGIGYEHVAGLGGFRRPHPGSLNTGWRNVSFRGYADYMQTPEFAGHLADIIAMAKRERIVLMCAEAVPWRCHRSLIADALVVHGLRAGEIISGTRRQVHVLTPFARVSGTIITYPPP
jgi:hypothetical protein